MARRILDPRTMDFPEETLRQLYITERLTIDQIAKKLGCSTTPVWRSLKRHGIQLKPSGGQYTYMDKGITRKLLKHLYMDLKLTQGELEQRFKANSSTITRALKHFGIPIRTQSEVNKLSAQKRVWSKTGHGRNWKGGQRLINNGYRVAWLPNHPRANNGYVFEHILVWEKVHGKLPPQGWIVHHLNGIKTDNRPENLVAMPRGAHHSLARPYKSRIRELETQLKALQSLKMAI